MRKAHYVSELRKSYLPQYAFLVLLTTQVHSQAQSKVITRTASRNDLQRLRRLGSQFEQLRQLLKIPGMSVAVVKDDKVLWAKGFGYADIQKQVPATPRT